MKSLKQRYHEKYGDATHDDDLELVEEWLLEHGAIGADQWEYKKRLLEDLGSDNSRIKSEESGA